jgi:N-acylneuraminate cytidylyltransferase
MNSGKVTAVVAVRKGSQRVPDKNVRPFGDSNLLQMKIDILKKVEGLDEIVVNSDCDYMLEVGKSNNCLTHKRNQKYANSQTSNGSFHHHIAEVTNTDHIFLAPVCSPFISVETHEKAIFDYMNSDFDSMTSVDIIKNHLWLDNKPLNYSLDDVPNSQDLPNVMRLNYGVAIVNRNTMLNRRGLVGERPTFLVLNDRESVDIDTMFDFNFAQYLYKTG